ncbi:MAG: zf-HC2 domain-containing protein [Desulfomonilaceae bacterium]|nr:zf-HC2 domain-containing protein [Desulfomonilaceae bacterium]
MKTSKPPESNNHPSELLLPYAENSLSPGDIRSVEQHLFECPECAMTVERLAETIRILKTHGDAFCPEPWELYEFLFHGEDPDRNMERHVRQCSSCRSLCDVWAAQPKSLILPDHLLRRIAKGSRETISAAAVTKGPRLFSSRRIFKRFMFPALGVGAAAAAAVLMFVLVMPGEIPQSVIAPGSVTWETVPKPKALQDSRYRTAVVVALKGFPTKWPQSRVDSLYRALAPTMELSQRFEILPPELVSETIREERTRLRTKHDMVTLLRKKLDVERVAIVVVSPDRDQMKIQGELIDTRGNVSLHRTGEKPVAKEDLNVHMKRMVTDLMISKGR